MSVSERLKQYCKVNGITQDSLVSKGFGTKQTINNYINGNTEAKSGFLEKFIKEFKLSAKWLMTGEEEKHNSTIELKTYQNEDKMRVAEDGCAMCIEKDKRILLLEKHIELLEFSLGKYRKNGSE